MKIILLLLFLTVGCSVQGYDLSRMPEYNFASVNENWPVVSELSELEGQMQMSMMMMSMAGGEPTEAEVAEVKKLYDQYLYWKAVTEVQVFHGDYKASKKSALKAKSAIEEVNGVVKAAAGRIGKVQFNGPATLHGDSFIYDPTKVFICNNCKAADYD